MTQGDHVRARRSGVWDHAIDVGDRTVIRYAPGRGIERCEYADFVAGADRVEVVVHRERVYRPSLVVARAFSRFAESAYGAMFGSPEQFAAWCKSGQLPAAGAPSAPARRPATGAKAPVRKAAARASRGRTGAAPRRKPAAARAARKPARKPARKAPRRAARRPARRRPAPRRPRRR